MLEQSGSEQNWLDSSARVLVVEDDPAINTLLAMALEETGYSVKVAWNGLEALNYLKQATAMPALILLDLTMPVMDGRQFLQELKAFKPTERKIPVVVLTASRQVIQIGEETGVAGYLPKPFDLDEVLGYVEKLTQS